MTCQLPLFELDDPPTKAHDPIALLREGAALVLSVSGGKDSDSMSHYLLDRRAKEGWPGPALSPLLQGTHDQISVMIVLRRTSCTNSHIRPRTTRNGFNLNVLRTLIAIIRHLAWRR